MGEGSLLAGVIVYGPWLLQVQHGWELRVVLAGPGLAHHPRDVVLAQSCVLGSEDGLFGALLGRLQSLEGRSVLLGDLRQRSLGLFACVSCHIPIVPLGARDARPEPSG